jgi:DNA modification methylase
MQLFEVEKLSIPSKLLRDKYIVPPFSILDAKSQYWLERKKDWENILQDRTNNVRNITSKGNTCYYNSYDNKDAYYGLKSKGSISTFDPFLTEILIKWFSNPGMTIFDPFAGGIVRGAVAGILGRNYLGYDINEAQVECNVHNWKLRKDKYTANYGDVTWLNKDSYNMDMKEQFDMMLTCPPYYNLEIYTDNENDLSNLKTYEEFLDKYTSIIKECYNKLKDNSFAVIVVAEIRDNNGVMYGFVPDTVNAFRQAGFQYYNEMILENRVVSLGVRCPKYFDQSRKVGRHHQNVLVFYKGDTREIENKFGAFSKE